MTASDPLHIGIVRNAHDPRITAKAPTWQAFCAGIQKPAIRPNKDGMGVVFATFNAMHRKAQNVSSVTALGYDIEQHGDGPFPPAPAEVAAALDALGLAYAIYTTFSDRPEARRFRVILPMARGLDPALLKDAYDLPLKYLPILEGVTDPKCRDAARLFYLPGCAQDRARQFENYCRPNGEWLNGASLALMAAAKRHQAEQARQGKLQRYQARTSAGGHSVIENFNAHNDPAAILAGAGYVQRGHRWISPNSHSGAAGVVILNGRVYSHHSDALGDGHAHDLFDLYSLLHHGGNKSAAARALRGGERP